MIWYSDHGFSIVMTKVQAQSASHQGQCDNDVMALSKDKKIARQIAKINLVLIAAELKEWGAWDSEQLADNDQNVQRLLWIIAGNINEGNY